MFFLSIYRYIVPVDYYFMSKLINWVDKVGFIMNLHTSDLIITISIFIQHTTYC